MAQTPQEARHTMAALAERAGPRRRLPTQAYSRVVRLLKVALPLAALALLIVVAAWPQIGDVPPDPPVVAKPEGPEMQDPRFFGTDNNNRPFTITAARASQPGGNANAPVALDSPDAEVTLSDGSWVNVSAREGRLDQASQMLRLDGDVTVFHDSGYEMRGQELNVKLEDGTVWSNGPVVGQGPSGEIAASGLRISDRGQTVVFTGRTRLVLRPDDAKPQGTLR